MDIWLMLVSKGMHGGVNRKLQHGVNREIFLLDLNYSLLSLFRLLVGSYGCFHGYSS